MKYIKFEYKLNSEPHVSAYPMNIHVRNSRVAPCHANCFVFCVVVHVPRSDFTGMHQQNRRKNANQDINSIASLHNGHVVEMKQIL